MDLVELGVDGRIIFKWMFNTYGGGGLDDLARKINMWLALLKANMKLAVYKTPGIS